MSGIVERADSERVVAERLPTVVDAPLKVINRRLPLTAAPGTTLADCLRLIQRSGTGDSVLVVDADGRLLGVLTERDIFGRLIGSRIDPGQPVESLMTTEPHTLRLEQTVRDAIGLMETGRYRNVPIVDAAGRLAGVVRQQDILRFLAESFPEELLNLPPRPHQQMEESEGA
ncbi:MAG TPA: CBS domain-containing protein [Candidatus Dormibacteraeota bacterium]|nr:CBS domain-containing protein [Candidatus Dormibacteraeota bacterium]